MTKSQELCAKLREFREEQKISQTELARMIDNKQQYIYQLEKGVHSPNISTFCAIADALGYDVVLVKKSENE